VRFSKKEGTESHGNFVREKEGKRDKEKRWEGGRRGEGGSSEMPVS